MLQKKQDNEVVNDAMISENNTRKFLRIIETDLAKLLASSVGFFMSMAIPGFWGTALCLSSFFATTYYGLKTILRANSVVKEDKALEKLEGKSSSVAQKEVKRQNDLLNRLENTFKSSEKAPVSDKKGILRRLNKGTQSFPTKNKQREAA